MKILAIADRNPHINIIDVVNTQAIDLIVTLGDLERSDIAALEFITHIPKLGVYGNHCSGSYMEGLGIHNMHRAVFEHQGLRFGGFEGCVRYKENPQAIMYTQEEAISMMQGFPPVDVFLSHCPPRGINDEEEIAHQGFDVLRTYLDTYHPMAWLHGHTYPTEETMVRMHGTTQIQYVHMAQIINIG
jgi:uncharacterized protein